MYIIMRLFIVNCEWMFVDVNVIPVTSPHPEPVAKKIETCFQENHDQLAML